MDVIHSPAGRPFGIVLGILNLGFLAKWGVCRVDDVGAALPKYRQLSTILGHSQWRGVSPARRDRGRHHQSNGDQGIDGPPDPEHRSGATIGGDL